jgi:hypothetical protein
MKIGTPYNIDCEFEGERLTDEIRILVVPTKKQRKVLVYSPKLRANILIWRKELKTV